MGGRRCHATQLSLPEARAAGAKRHGTPQRGATRANCRHQHSANRCSRSLWGGGGGSRRGRERVYFGHGISAKHWRCQSNGPKYTPPQHKQGLLMLGGSCGALGGGGASIGGGFLLRVFGRSWGRPWVGERTSVLVIGWLFVVFGVAFLGASRWSDQECCSLGLAYTGPLLWLGGWGFTGREMRWTLHATSKPIEALQLCPQHEHQDTNLWDDTEACLGCRPSFRGPGDGQLLLITLNGAPCHPAEWPPSASGCALLRRGRVVRRLTWGQCKPIQPTPRRARGLHAGKRVE